MTFSVDGPPAPEMAIIRRGDATVRALEGETVLDALARIGAAPPSSCRAGACQSCILRARVGTPPPEAQLGLRESLRRRGYFLSCRAHATEDLEIDDGDELRIAAKLVGLARLSHDVLQVRVLPERTLDHRAGQYVTLMRADGLSRSYSIASASDVEELELHVRVVPGGAMSQWLAYQASVGDVVALRGPAGDCFYSPGRPEQPLLLAGTGTGAAPLLGFVRDALRHGHTGRIVLAHGARVPAGLYLDAELSHLADVHDNLEFHRVVLDGAGVEGVEVGSLDAVLTSLVAAPKGWRIVLCGDPVVVQSMRRRMFLAGASMSDIRADAFVPSAAATGS